MCCKSLSMLHYGLLQESLAFWTGMVSNFPSGRWGWRSELLLWNPVLWTMNREVRKNSWRIYSMTIHQGTVLRSSFPKKPWLCAWVLSLWIFVTYLNIRLREYTFWGTHGSHRTERTLLKSLLLLSTQNFKSGFSRCIVAYISPSHVEVPFFLIPLSLYTCQCAPDPFFWLLVSCALFRWFQRLPWASHSPAVGWSLLWYCQAPHCGSSR